MKIIISVISFFLMLLVFCSSSNSQKIDHAANANLDTLVSWMTGSFSSENQAHQDTDFVDVRLHMISIWPYLENGHWMYVEQALASRLEKPYRQRVYHIFLNDSGKIQSDVYTFADPLRFAGAYKNQSTFSTLTPDSLQLRKGCSTFLERFSELEFTGGTRGPGCESAFRGAAYVTTQVNIFRDKFISWDRGFDAQGKQVWGAEKSGYIFLKLSGY